MPTFWGTNNKKLFNENKPLFDSKKNILDGLSEKLTEAGIPQVKPFEKKPNTTIKASFGDLLQSPFYLASKFVVEPTFKFLASGIELATKKETPRIEIPVIGKTKFFGEDKLVNIASYQNQYKDLIEAGIPEKEAYKNVFVGGLMDAIQIASPVKSVTKTFIPKTSLIKPKITGAISREQLFDFFSGRKSAAQLGMSDDIVKTISEKMKIMPTKEKIDFLKGFDLIEAEPSFIGKMFGVTKQEAESLMKKLYGGPARQASFGELPGTREVPGQAPSMGLSTRKVETVGKTTSLDEFVKTDDIIDVDSKLINEAKKFKSAEEFSNKIFFRGEPTESKLSGEPFGSLIKETKTGLPKTAMGVGGIPVSKDFVTARGFGSEVRGYIPKTNAKILSNPSEIIKIAQVKSAHDFYFKAGKVPSVDSVSFYEKVKQAGYDAVDLSEVEKLHRELPSNTVFLKGPEQEMRIINKNAFTEITNPPKTKSQLTDIWNKANQATSTQDLVKENKLIAVHNLSEQKLFFADRIGGLANPSLAVINPKLTSFENFGDISLIGSKDLIEGEKTHLADAYSPRFPSLHSTMKWGDFYKFEEDMKPYYDKLGDKARKVEHDDREMIRNIENNPGVALRFLEENGIKPDAKGPNYYFPQIEKQNLSGKFQKFLDNLYEEYGVKEQLFAGYTPSGQRRYKPVSVQEASKIMGKEKSEGMSYGLGSYRSKVAPVKRYTSQIRKEAGRLVNKEEFEAIKESYDNELYSLKDKLEKYVKSKDSNQFIENDRQLETIGSVLMGEKDAWKYFDNKFVDIPRSLTNEVIAFKNKLKSMPTEYFETKFKRPVDLREFSKAIVPDTITPEAKKLLENKGLEVITYTPGKKGEVMQSLLKSKEAFAKKPLFNRDVKMGSEEVRKIILDGIEKAGYSRDDLRVLFSDEALGDNAIGVFEQENKWLGNLIRLYEKDGKVGIVTALHEQKHFLFSKLSPELQEEAYAAAKEEMGVMYKTILEKGYKPEGKYAGEQREKALLEEYIVDKWAKAEAGAKYGYKQSIYGRVFEALDNLIKKIVETYKKIKDYIKSLPNKQGGFVRIIPETSKNLEGIKDQISFMEEVLSNHPGKELIKYVSKSTGRLPEITGKRTMQAVSGSGKIVKTSEFGVKGDDILQSVAGYGKDGDEIIEEYRRMKDNLNALKEDLKEIRTQESLDRISKKLAEEQEKMIQFSKRYPELARFTLKLTEQETRGAIKGYKLGLEVASRTIKKDVMDTVKAAYDKKIARIKDSKEILQNRRTLIKAVQKQFGIGDDDLKAITRRDIRLMSNYEFKQFLDDIRAKSEEFMVRRQAQNELIAQINEKELNIEPLREAMKFPPISEMSTEQLRNFDAILEKYKQGDVFLSKRKLETIERTELKDIKTYREAREILAKKIGVKPEELNNIKISEFDRFKSFSSLAETNPFFKMVVEETTKLRLQADAEYLAIEKQANKLAKKVKTTFIQKLIPQQKNIRAWFEAKDKSTVRLTKEESDLVNFMMKEWGKARDELVIKQVMDRGIQTMNYFTHIRRGILEAVKEDGVIQAAKEVFDQYKLDEQNFNILDTETGEVLAMDKFFRFALRRTGELKPTENIVGAFLNYMKMYKRKQALDEIVPLIDIYAHALTPKGTTEKGLLLHGDMIRFMKEWLNTQKGRRITLLSKQGGKIDWALKSIKSFTTLLDLGLNIPVSVATQIGEQAIQYQLLGKGKFLKAKYRALTKRGRRITNKYRNLVGKNPWTQLVEPMRSIGDRLNEGIFTLFQDANIRRNKNVMLGLMTKEEWASETITPERLAQLKIATGRYGVVDGIGSIVGATPESKIVTQYKTWAIPIMTSQVKNLTYMAKYLGTLGKANKKEAARAMAETWRMLELGAFVAIVAGAFVDKEDDSFLGKLKLRAIQEANTLFGAAPAMTTIPRMIGFLTDLAKNTISLIKLEEYKSNKFGEYEVGDLRGLKALEKMLTPRAIKQFQTTPIKTIEDVRAEIKDDIQSGALSISAAKEKYISELNKLKNADKKARFKLKQDEYKKDLAERIKNKEITISEAKEEYIDYVKANVDSFSSKDEGSFIDKVLLYAKAFGTDPVTASIYLFQGEKIRRVDNGAIIVERMTLEESQGIKKERGATSDMILDHIIPLQLGGSNSKNNLKLVDTDEWSSYTPVENYIGDKLRAGMIDKKEAQRLIKEFKDGKITKEQIMK